MLPKQAGSSKWQEIWLSKLGVNIVILTPKYLYLYLLLPFRGLFMPVLQGSAKKYLW
jgi:hypothetical protein